MIRCHQSLLLLLHHSHERAGLHLLVAESDGYVPGLVIAWVVDRKHENAGAAAEHGLVAQRRTDEVLNGNLPTSLAYVPSIAILGSGGNSRNR